MEALNRPGTSAAAEARTPCQTKVTRTPRRMMRRSPRASLSWGTVAAARHTYTRAMKPMRWTDVLRNMPSRRQKETTATRVTEGEASHRRRILLKRCASPLDISGGASGARSAKPTCRVVNTVLKPAASCSLRIGLSLAMSQAPNGLGRTCRPPQWAVGKHVNSGESNPDGENGMQFCKTRARGDAGTDHRRAPSGKKRLAKGLCMRGPRLWPRRHDEDGPRRIR